MHLIIFEFRIILLVSCSIINDSRTTAEPVHLIRPIDAATESSIIVAAKMKLDNQLDWVKKYFKDPMSCGNVIKFTDFCFEGGTDFEIKVWKTLFENVKVGETISYANLAAAIDNPSKIFPFTKEITHDYKLRCCVCAQEPQEPWEQH